MITVVSDRLQQERYKTTLKDKESKSWTLRGKTIYTVFLQMHIANQQVLLSKYDFLIWDCVSKFMDKLPESSSVEFKTLIKEGR